ncbi:GNAT family N-acetyltransferase [Rheinheimera aquimaris]|jgi:GNAT superfamily N-acetyltransferase|uniref:GNAT family N-acetyltransferase n=1 Tax=Rheinheimera aquimaris TaxID=412437 RepID=UPI00197D3329|nr:GNAT family N-acetyltransferase [Rheinheimera aquimaris]MCD1600318.1 GNAT family N-acetyltransferase [Rheinheimera aquimaris]|tara:strand:+ start:5478 stop:5849 length:372 start_codon:yes stop_codon:yes gene_type:complete
MSKVVINDDKSQLDVAKIHDFLTHHSSWAKGISLATVTTSIEHSICFGAYLNAEQVGFCRVITDQATFANLVDVIVWPEHRGNGISRLLMAAVLQHPVCSMSGVLRWPRRMRMACIRSLALPH